MCKVNLQQANQSIIIIKIELKIMLHECLNKKLTAPNSLSMSSFTANTEPMLIYPIVQANSNWPSSTWCSAWSCHIESPFQNGSTAWKIGTH